MNSLSSEDLNEEKNCSLTLDATLNPYACQTPNLTSPLRTCALRRQRFPFRNAGQPVRDSVAQLGL